MTVAFRAAVPMVARAAMRESQPMTVSPCAKICTLDPVSGLCSGCGRSLAEIERWPTPAADGGIGRAPPLHAERRTVRDA